MNKISLRVFSNPMFGSTRIVWIDDECWFCLVDVCRALELQAAAVMRRLDEGMTVNHPIVDALGRSQQANFVNKDGLYEVLFNSRKPIAKAFCRWVQVDILPSLHTHVEMPPIHKDKKIC